MQLIKGFVTINQFINNTPELVSPLGEISTWSMTYSKEIGTYQDNAILGYRLLTFKSVDSLSSIKLPVASSQATEILSVVKECVAYSGSHIQPHNPLDFKNNLMVAFYGLISDLNFGEFVSIGAVALPAWVSWKSVVHDGNEIRIWLSDPAFADQYDEFEITVIPPLEPLDNFFGFYNTIVNTLSQQTIDQLSNKIQEFKDIHPETYLRMLTFNFTNRYNPVQKTPTTWAVLIYGKAGDYIDTIKDAIVEYILANSTHSREEWKSIFSDIFDRTEFFLLPRWDQVSIPNLTELSALYRTMLSPVECIEFTKNALPFLESTFIDNNINTMAYDYKAITIISVNGLTNVEGKRKLEEIFPDYLPVSSTTLDFNRMTVKTREWLLVVGEILILAETATELTSLPLKFRRIKRDNILFITFLYDNVNYLIATKSNGFYNESEV